MLNDQNLIAQCLAQDRLAQKELYERYKRAMYTLAYRLTNDFEAAAEVLQDAFLQVFKGLDTFKGESTLGAWIKTIVIRTAYKKIKTKVIFEELPPQYSDEKVVYSDALDVEYLEKTIHSLPEGFRTVFTLIEIEGYTHKEAAEILNISEGTSKSQLFYAKKRLREMLSY
jgi:RNA polymerase sigma factor (sigma-70 family)